MSVEKQLKATSGYGMLATVIAALLAIVGLFIWSIAGIARPSSRVHPLWQVRGHRARRGLFLGKPVL